MRKRLKYRDISHIKGFRVFGFVHVILGRGHNGIALQKKLSGNVARQMLFVFLIALNGVNDDGKSLVLP